ncbi:DNA-formamidopyrimidine glycosylase family protein [Microbacterium terricola]|uniref:DNA-(apurinic or apyrimidinic site) lyase n=1 Tax=Microbacterium terricola TaxID=344163 RepID=A0ABM8DVE3_9MICO|nr:DNA-formamidopyrimidine glycosylase family protein [Microbacterium terricola]UYK39612.1 Fpg/Nei family DNA glycosylase [Microbacterium terricola]BDV29648.1 putative endonuclease 8 2 [Microbacterium terricola]
MPEGDTVYRTARRLDEALTGAEVTRFELRVPRAATADLTGERVGGSVSRGKHLLLRVGEWTLHSHLKMEGEWRVFARGARWSKPAFTARAIVGTAAREAVGFELAEVKLVPTRDEEELVGYLGPDPLADDWDPALAAARLQADPRPVHVAIQDQRNIAGFGNEYANEILFVRGVLPTTPATEVDAAALVDLGARMIRANRDRTPRTFTGDARPGRATWVYGREHRPCRRCGTLVRRSELGADPTKLRNVFWCPACQR